MEFKQFKSKLQQHVQQILKNHEVIFETEIDKDKIVEVYLTSFKKGTNEIFRKRPFHDCNCCKHFIRLVGNLVVIENNKLISIWDFDAEDKTYQPVINDLSRYVKSVPIVNVFVTKDLAFGTDKNFEQRDDGSVHTWHHFRLDLPAKFKSKSSKTVNTVKSDFKAIKEVFKRSLEEISKDAIETILDLISQKSLYDGSKWQKPLELFLELHNKYQTLPEEEKDPYCWIESVKAGPGIAKIKNHSIGVLLTDLSKGVELNQAVGKFEHEIAGPNYKRPKPIYSEKQVEKLKEAMANAGYLESIGRRYANIEDIRSLDDVLFINRNISTQAIDDVDLFSQMQKNAISNPKKFNKVEEVGIEDFVNNILPRLTSIELYLENKHSSNLVSLIAPKVKDSKIMFKWNNGLCWAYTKNMTDSIMKERVKEAGGKVDGPLRFSIEWNKYKYNPNDFDAHCIEPNKNRIYFSNKFPYIHPSSGRLDVDHIHPRKGQIVVENITWLDRKKMQEGIYKFSVHCFNNRGGTDGFEAEIEVEGQIYSFVYNQGLRHDEYVHVADLEWHKDGTYKFIKSLPSSTSSRKIWNIQTNKFHPVSVMCLSPNYWGGEIGKGRKHYFFLLEGCKSNETPNGFYNEYLNEDLVRDFKHALEALGSNAKVEPSDNQLSGLGFNSDIRNSVICRVNGHTSRILKINF